MSTRSRSANCWPCVALVVAAGCGGNAADNRPLGQQLPAAAVEGEVRVEGRPAPRLRVLFHPLSGPAPQTRVFDTLTDGLGRFRCTTNVPGDGLPPGVYRVTFSWPETVFDDPLTENDKLGERFKNPQRSTFRVEITPGANRLPPFELQ